MTKVSYFANEWLVFTVDTSSILPPKGNDRINTYPFYIPMKLEGVDIDWVRGTVLTINGEITFRDCLGDTQIQDFGGLYACSANGFDKIKPLGIVPDQSKECES